MKSQINSHQFYYGIYVYCHYTKPTKIDTRQDIGLKYNTI